jgi:hypothetical protein
VLRSDLEWDHFFLAEFDTDIAKCDYAPFERSILLKESGAELPVTAVITYKNGEICFRNIRYSQDQQKNGYDIKDTARLIQTAAEIGIRYEPWTEIDIRRNPVQLANWRRMIAWLAAAREHALAWHIGEVASMFRSHQTFTLGDVETAWGEAAFPLYAAAIFQAVLEGTFSTDTDTEILSLKTIVGRKAAQ